MVNLFIFNNRTTDTGSIGEAEERIFSFSCTEDGFSECCAVDIIFYCDRNMETLLKDFLKLCTCVIRDVAVGINDIPFFRVDLTGGADADGIKWEGLLCESADGFEDVRAAFISFSRTFTGFHKVSVLTDSIFDCGSADVKN